MKRSTWTATMFGLLCAGGMVVGARQLPPAGGNAAYVADLSARRAAVMQAIGSDAVLVLWSAPPRTYSADVNYEYRQESNLLYLSGVSQEQTTLVLIPGARTRRAVLFIREPDPIGELWFGHRLTPAEAAATSGISTVYTQKGTEVFQSFMAALLSAKGHGESDADAATEFGTFFRSVQSGRARLGILGRIADRDADAGLGRDQDPQVAWARDIAVRFPSVTPFSAADLLLGQRRIKTAYEQMVLRRSIQISAAAHVEGMKATRPGKWEYEVEAAIESWFLRNGALSWGYPSIVASGPNATTLHYLQSARQMQRGDLLLVDAAASYQGLTGDITRTYPVAGRFSPDQRALYDVVLRAQDAGIAAATPGASVEAVVKVVRHTMGQGLRTLGLVDAVDGPALDSEISLWFPHSPIHGIGMDVHETVTSLDPGTAFVIEPGVYVRADTVDRLRRMPDWVAFVHRIAPALSRYRDVGVRVEDSFLMTPSGPTMLSDLAPRRVIDIEKVVGRGR